MQPISGGAAQEAGADGRRRANQGEAMSDRASAAAPTKRTRRQMLAGGTGAVAAVLAAGVLARPAPAAAADGDNVILGQANSSTNPTSISNTNSADPDRGGADLGQPGAGHVAAGPGWCLGPLSGAEGERELVQRASEQGGTCP